MRAFTSFEGARLPIGVRVLAGHAELGVALLVARSPRGAVGPRLLVLDVGLARGRGVGLREVRLVAASTVAKRECAACEAPVWLHNRTPKISVAQGITGT